MRATSAIVGLTGATLALILAPAGLGATGTRTFTTAGEYSFIVPTGVSGVDVLLVGGNGGVGAGGARGGAGASVTATLAVVPGEQLFIEVAGDGVTAASSALDAGNGGYGGGGYGGGDLSFPGAPAPAGGGGGGASDIRTMPCGSSCNALGAATLGSRLIVAGGGGGGGGTTNSHFNAEGAPGGGGDESGSSGQMNNGLAGGAGGKQGTASAGGAGGNPDVGSGVLGAGGSGDTSFGSGGGGGGGGIYGGGGGGAGAVAFQGGMATGAAGAGGGGGGASGIPAGSTGVSNYHQITTAAGAEPAVTLTWSLPPPPTIGGLRVHSRIHRHGHRHSTTIELRLSQAATLTFTFARKKHGHYVDVPGSRIVMGRAGVDKFAFAGALSHRGRLEPGSYRLTVVATNSAGETSAPSHARFRVS